MSKNYLNEHRDFCVYPQKKNVGVEKGALAGGYVYLSIHGRENNVCARIDERLYRAELSAESSKVTAVFDLIKTLLEVISPIEVISGHVAPWFGQCGGGIQYLIKTGRIIDLLQEGIIKVFE